MNKAKIWKQQSIDEETMAVLDPIARAVFKFIRDTPPSVSDIREYCKKPDYWDEPKKSGVIIEANAKRFGANIADVIDEANQAVQERVE